MKRSNLFKFICLLVFLFTVIGWGPTRQTGVTFASVTPNLSLPPAYTTRSIYESGVAAYDFYDLVGNVLVISNDISQQPLRVTIVRPSKYSDSIPIKLLTQNESLNYYHSVITKGAAVQGNYLAFSAKFSDDEIADYTLVDIAQSSINLNQASFTEVANGLRAFVNDHPKPANINKRVWVKSVVLSSSLYTAGNKISANASGVLGSTLGVNGSVYNTNNQTIKGTIIGFDYIDVDQLVGALSKGPLTSELIKTLEKNKPMVLSGLQKSE
jgi:hypothetical protein